MDKIRDIMVAIKDGIYSPDLVGEYVVKAIHNDEFYIFCDGHRSRQLVKQRYQVMMEAFNRQFPE